MRIPAWCSECVAPGKMGEHSPADKDMYLVDVEDDNAYVGRCQNGHLIIFTLQTMRFELLFESGIVALLAGFHREAVSSMAAALERFYEFSVEAFVEIAEVPDEGFEDVWKLAATQSERQLGAYLFLYLTTYKRPAFGSKPARKEFQDWTEFRNGVIHKGQFPPRARVLDYAKYVFDLIRDRKAELREHAPRVYERVEWRYTMRSHRAAESKRSKLEPVPVPNSRGHYPGVGGAAFSTMLAPMNAEAPMDFESRLKIARANLWVWGVTARDNVAARATPPADGIER